MTRVADVSDAGGLEARRWIACRMKSSGPLMYDSVQLLSAITAAIYLVPAAAGCGSEVGVPRVKAIVKCSEMLVLASAMGVTLRLYLCRAADVMGDKRNGLVTVYKSAEHDRWLLVGCLYEGKSPKTYAVGSAPAAPIVIEGASRYIVNGLCVPTDLNACSDPTRDWPVRSPCCARPSWYDGAKKGDYQGLDAAHTRHENAPVLDLPLLRELLIPTSSVPISGLAGVLRHDFEQEKMLMLKQKEKILLYKTGEGSSRVVHSVAALPTSDVCCGGHANCCDALGEMPGALHLPSLDHRSVEVLSWLAARPAKRFHVTQAWLWRVRCMRELVREIGFWYVEQCRYGTSCGKSSATVTDCSLTGFLWSRVQGLQAEAGYAKLDIVACAHCLCPVIGEASHPGPAIRTDEIVTSSPTVLLPLGLLCFSQTGVLPWFRNWDETSATVDQLRNDETFQVPPIMVVALIGLAPPWAVPPCDPSAPLVLGYIALDNRRLKCYAGAGRREIPCQHVGMITIERLEAALAEAPRIGELANKSLQEVLRILWDQPREIQERLGVGAGIRLLVVDNMIATNPHGGYFPVDRGSFNAYGSE